MSSDAAGGEQERGEPKQESGSLVGVCLLLVQDDERGSFPAMAKPVLTPDEAEGMRILIGTFVVISIIVAIVVALSEEIGLREPDEKVFARECRAHGGKVDGVRCIVRYGATTYDLPMESRGFDEGHAADSKAICDEKRADGQSYRFHPRTGVCAFHPRD